MNIFGLWTAAFLTSVSVGSAMAQLRDLDMVPLDEDRRIRYDDDDLVDIEITTQAQLSAIENLAVTIWSEHPGIGTNRVQLDEGALAKLNDLGVRYTVVHENVQALIDAEWVSIQAADQQRGGSWYNTYHQYDEIVTHFNEIAAAHPALATRESAGTSLQGRDIPAVRITGPGDASSRPVVFINGGQHAREWIGPATVMYLAERLMEDYGSNPRVTALLDAAEIVIAPIVNPDGYVYTWTSQRMWRKNRRGGYGVDLNRNWGWEWGGLGSSGDTSNDTYRGASAFSEPETSALRDYALADSGRIVASIDYHSYSQLILWPWGYDEVDPPAHVFDRFEMIGFGIRNEILNAGGVPYLPEPSWQLYPAAGNAVDWFFGATGSTAYTIELRDTGDFGFILPADQILPTASENWAGFLYFAEETIKPISVVLAEDAPTSVGASQSTILDLSILDGSSYYLVGTTKFYTSVNGGPFVQSQLNTLSANSYQAVFPTTPCGSIVSYYFTAEAGNGATVSLPAGGESAPFEATSTEAAVVFHDAMESGTNGWTAGIATDTATTGQWELGNPQSTGAQPEDDDSANGVNCWITGPASGTSIGSFDVDGGTTTLISPRFDASAAADDGFDTILSYSRWYSNDQGNAPNADSMPIEISNNDGASWTLVELVSENLNRWERKEFNIGSIITPTAQMRVRFVARDLGDGSIVEAGVDEFRVETRGCPCAGADLNCDGSLDFFDVQLFLGMFASQDLAADFNGDGTLDFFDVLGYLDLFSQG